MVTNIFWLTISNSIDIQTNIKENQIRSATGTTCAFVNRRINADYYNKAKLVIIIKMISYTQLCKRKENRF